MLLFFIAAFAFGGWSSVEATAEHSVRVQATGPRAFELAIQNPSPVAGVTLALKDADNSGRIVSAIAAESTQMLEWSIEFNDTHVHAEGSPEQIDNIPYAEFAVPAVLVYVNSTGRYCLEGVELKDDAGQNMPYSFSQGGDCTLVSICPLPGDGDVNQDGDKDIVDGVIILNNILKIANSTLSECQRNIADANADFDVNIVDATIIIQNAVGLT